MCKKATVQREQQADIDEDLENQRAFVRGRRDIEQRSPERVDQSGHPGAGEHGVQSGADDAWPSAPAVRRQRIWPGIG
jgi:hypothetical protein